MFDDSNAKVGLGACQLQVRTVYQSGRGQANDKVLILQKRVDSHSLCFVHTLHYSQNVENGKQNLEKRSEIASFLS